MASNSLNDHSQRQLYVVHCFDGSPAATEHSSLVADPARNGPHDRRCLIRRVEYYEEHVAYQLATSMSAHRYFVEKVAAAPKLDGSTIIGSSFLLCGNEI